MFALKYLNKLFWDLDDDDDDNDTGDDDENGNLLQHKWGSSLSSLQIVASSEALRKWNTPA